jgi:hypothetical protein
MSPKDPQYLPKYLSATLANGHLSFLMYRERQTARLLKELGRLQLQKHPKFLLTGLCTPQCRSTDSPRLISRLRLMWHLWLLGLKRLV